MQVASYSTERRTQRVSATIPISLVMQMEDSKTKHDAWMVDISSKGARVRTALVLLAGQVVGIIASGDSGQAVPYRVVWVERSSSGCLAGLALLETAQA
jgi:hypothetical protein